jgi:hypothetical protein
MVRTVRKYTRVRTLVDSFLYTYVRTRVRTNGTYVVLRYVTAF